jgi:hypothetical protein
MKRGLLSTTIIIASASVIILIGLIEIPAPHAIRAASFPEQNCISNGGNGGDAGNGGSAGNDGNQVKDKDILSGTAHNINKEVNDRDIQRATSVRNDGKSIDTELTKDDLSEGVRGTGGNGGNGGNGGRAVTMCILIAPVINIDSNIPLDPNAVLVRPNLSYAPHLRMG